MGDSFHRLSTVPFQQKMQPHADAIYAEIWPGCTLKKPRRRDGKAHVIDREFGVDRLIFLPTGQYITLQEKYREYRDPEKRDYTQEYKNAAGTAHESDGEFFKLGAQLYFYGWANQAQDAFDQWFIFDVAQYKLIVEQAGGLARIGRLEHNARHGRASFYGIPLWRLRDAVLYSSDAHIVPPQPQAPLRLCP